MPDQLGKALCDASIPDSSVKLLVDRRPGRLRWPSGHGRSGGFSRLPIAAATAALLLVLFVSLTPPGRALADDIAALVGIGDEPTLDQSSGQPWPARGPAVVVAAGMVPGTSQRYEISAYAAEETQEVRGSGGPFGCLNFDLPGLETQKQVKFESLCLDYPQRKPLEVISASDNLDRLGGQARFSVGGLTAADVADVKVTYESSAGTRAEASVALAVLTPEVAEQTGSPQTFGRFVAFMPDDRVGDEGEQEFPQPIFRTVEVTAYDMNGDVVAVEDGRKLMPPETIAAAGGPPDEAVTEALTRARNQALLGKLGDDLADPEIVPLLNALIDVESGHATGAELMLLKRNGAGSDLIRQLQAVGAFPKGLSVPSKPLPSLEGCSGACSREPVDDVGANVTAPTIDHLDVALARAREGEIHVDGFSRRDLIQTLNATISLTQDGRVTPREKRALRGGRANLVLDSLRASGDFPEDPTVPLSADETP